MANLRQLGNNQTQLGNVPGFGSVQKANNIAGTLQNQQQTQNPIAPPIAVPPPNNTPAAGWGETPVERGQIPGAGGGAPRAGSSGPTGNGGPTPASLASSLQGIMGQSGSQATPSTPMTPTTAGAGSSFQAGGPPSMPSGGSVGGYNPGQMVTPQSEGLFGSMGGLKGGGLGVPLQPGNPALSNPISLLMNVLQNGMK